MSEEPENQDPGSENPGNGESENQDPGSEPVPQIISEPLANEVYRAYSRLLARNLAPAYAILRTELAKPEYQGLDDDAVWTALTTPNGTTIELDPVPVEHVRAALSQIAFLSAVGENAKWEKIATSQTALLAGVVEVPRDRLANMAQAAIAAGVLPEEYTIGEVQQTTLERLGLAGLIDSPIHLHLAREAV
jgi:hypothetical protein